MQIDWLPLVIRNIAMSWQYYGLLRIRALFDAVLIVLGAFIGSVLTLVIEWLNEITILPFLIPTTISIVGYLLAGIWFKRWNDKGAAGADKVSDYFLIILSGLFTGGVLTFIAVVWF